VSQQDPSRHPPSTFGRDVLESQSEEAARFVVRATGKGGGGNPFDPANVDPVLQNVAYVYDTNKAPEDTKGAVGAFHTEVVDSEALGGGEGAGVIVSGPGVGVGLTESIPKHSNFGSGISYGKGTVGYDEREGGLRRVDPAHGKEHFSEYPCQPDQKTCGSNPPGGYIAPK
jgi:hypothetical protein